MTVVEFRKLAARVNLLRAHVELDATCERNQEHRAALEFAIGLLVDSERVILEQARKAAL